MNKLVGQTLSGRYRVEEFIGRGGMAEVYKVWDRDRATHLALKLLREDLAYDPVFLRRFRREAKTLVKLQHPNVVRFYELEQDNLLAFLLMDYVEGTSLRAEIFLSRGKGLAVRRILEIMRPVCSALHYAHQMGIVHCDTKPGNIMIDNSGKVLVTDFGIARMSDAATATMVGMGTPAYMAPELVRGQEPTPQTDIYALGVILFEMLTGGERPFTGEKATITGSTSEKVRWEQLNLIPHSPRTLNPEISPEMSDVVMTCLSKSPKKRFRDVLVFLNALVEAASRGLISEEVWICPVCEQRVDESQSICPGCNQGRVSRYAGDSISAKDEAGPFLESPRLTSVREGKCFVASEGLIRLIRNHGSFVLISCMIVVVILGLVVGVGRNTSLDNPTGDSPMADLMEDHKSEIETQVVQTVVAQMNQSLAVMVEPTSKPQATATLPMLTDTVSPTPMAPQAFITVPTDGSSVGRRVNVRGTIEGLSDGMRAFLCIRSKVFGRLIWPQGEIFPNASGKWDVLGIYQSVGYMYETFVVVTDNPAAAEMLADQFYRANGMAELPHDTNRISLITTVLRE